MGILLRCVKLFICIASSNNRINKMDRVRNRFVEITPFWQCVHIEISRNLYVCMHIVQVVRVVEIALHKIKAHTYQTFRLCDCIKRFGSTTRTCCLRFGTTPRTDALGKTENSHIYIYIYMESVIHYLYMSTVFDHANLWIGIRRFIVHHSISRMFGHRERNDS